MTMIVARAAVAAVVMILGSPMSATAAPPRTPPLTGVWSGDRVTLTLTATGGELVADCAVSTIAQPVRADARGRFVTTADHVESHGGPMRVDDETRVAVPTAALKGQVSGSTLALEVSVAGNASTHYALTPGVHHKRIRCL